jgi:voltage-gated potassium channel Kch
MIAALRYSDTFVKIDSAWLFAQRLLYSTGWRNAHCHAGNEQAGFGNVNAPSVCRPKVPHHCGRARVVKVFSLNAKLQSRPDLLLLLSLLLAILLTPVLNQDNWRRLVLAAVTFIPIVLSIVRLSQIKRWMWPSVLLALGNAVFVVAGNTFPNATLTGIRWAFLAAFFGLTAAGLFSHLRNSRSVARAQLYTAVNIYLLLGLLWATLYLAIDAFSPGSIQIGSHSADRQTEMLYFSLVTLSTIGYGDIVPLSGEARIAAALEGVTGVLYIAITVALLVGRFRSEFSD